MSDLYTAGKKIADISRTPGDATAVRNAIELVESREDTRVGPESLSSVLEFVSESDCNSLLYVLEEAAIVGESGVNHERLRAAAGCGQAIAESGSEPENEVVANVPEGEEEIVGRHLGSLVVRLMEMFGDAEESIVILNPFFTEEAFRNVVSPVSDALERNVSVTLVTRYLTYGNDEDSRNFVREVLSEADSGEENLLLYEYLDPDEDRSATIHAKMTLIDDEMAYLGTANLTHRGLRDNLELGMILRDETVDSLGEFVEGVLGSQYLHRVVNRGGEFERI